MFEVRKINFFSNSGGDASYFFLNIERFIIFIVGSTQSTYFLVKLKRFLGYYRLGENTFV